MVAVQVSAPGSLKSYSRVKRVPTSTVTPAPSSSDGATFCTVIEKTSVSLCPKLSVTVTVAVCGESCLNTCCSVNVLLEPRTSGCIDSLSKRTVPVQPSSVPVKSVKLPVAVKTDPSETFPNAAGVMLGARSATTSSRISTVDPPSSSVTTVVTV